MSGSPDHWFVLTERGFELPVAIFDLDGVISDAGHRQWFLRAEPPDWAGFFAAADQDPLLAEGRDEVERYRRDHLVVIVTARPMALAPLTLRWLALNDMAIDLVVLRPADDDRSSPDVKRDELNRLRAVGAVVRVAFDDDPRIVEMYEREGVTARYVHSGFYDDGPA